MFGRASAIRAREVINEENKHVEVPQDVTEKILGRFYRLRHANGTVATSSIRKNMQDHPAVFRTQDVLDKGCTKMHQVADSINDIKVTVRLSRLVNAQKHP